MLGMFIMSQIPGTGAHDVGYVHYVTNSWDWGPWCWVCSLCDRFLGLGPMTLGMSIMWQIPTLIQHYSITPSQLSSVDCVECTYPTAVEVSCWWRWQ